MITHMHKNLFKYTAKPSLWLALAVLIISSPSNSSILHASADTNLQHGDLAVIGVNSDGPGVLSLLALTDIKDGTVVFITDHSWTGTSFSSAVNLDGVLTWTADTYLPRGTVVTITATKLEPAEFSASAGLLSSNGWNTTSQGAWGGGFGDSILLYQGSDLAPNFIFAFTNRSDNIDRDPLSGFYIQADPNKSTLPANLSNNKYSTSLSGTSNHLDNLCYNGPKSGSKNELLSNIHDPSNWVGNGGIGNTAIEDFTTICGANNFNVMHDLYLPIISK